MKPSVTILLTAAAFAGLVLLDRTLARGTTAARRATVRVERLVPQHAQEDRIVAAIELRFPGRPEVMYVRSKGHWRCLSAFGAPARGDLLMAIVNTFFDARGVRRNLGEGGTPGYGVRAESRLGVSFHGPGVLAREDRDVLFSFDVGTAFDGGRHGRAYVLDNEEDRLLEIDRDPRRLLAWPSEDPLPPLLDRRILSGAWVQPVSDFRRVFVDFEDGRSLEIYQRPVTPEEPGVESGRIEWIVNDGEHEHPCMPFRIAGYLSYLVRAPYSGLGDPKATLELGHAPPLAKVTIVPRDGAPLELAVGQVALGSTFVRNGTSGLFMQTSADLGPLLAADLGMLTDSARLNPWEAWLSR